MLSLIKYPFSASSSGSTFPGAPNQSVQFNNSGSFGGSANFLWNNATNLLTINGKAIVGNITLDNTNSPLQSSGSVSIQSSDSIYVNSILGAQTFSLFTSSSKVPIARIGNEINTYFGVNAGKGGDFVSVTAIGFNAVGSGNNSSQNLTAIGVNALLSNTTGTQNVAVGVNAGFSNTTGSGSLYIGDSSGFNITSGSFNTLFGPNSFVSSGIFHNNNGITGSGNTSIGYAGGSGGLSFAGVTTIINNSILIGSNTGVFAEGNNLHNVTIIGNNVTTSLSNVVMIGGSNQTILIGTANNTTPDGNMLQINGSLSIQPISLPVVPVHGSLETDGTHLYWTDFSGTRHTIV